MNELQLCFKVQKPQHCAVLSVMHEWLYLARDQCKSYFSLLFPLNHWNAVNLGVTSLPVTASNFQSKWNMNLTSCWHCKPAIHCCCTGTGNN